MMTNRAFLGGPIDGEERCLDSDLTVVDIYIDGKTRMVEWGLSLNPHKAHDARHCKVHRYGRSVDAGVFWYAGVVVDGRVVAGEIKSE